MPQALRGQNHRRRGDPSSVLVRQIVALDQLAGATVIGGSAGLDRPVDDVVMLSAALSAEKFASERSLVVMDASVLHSDTYQVDVALRTVHEANASALLLCAPSTRVGVATTRLANKFQVPLVVLPGADPLMLTDALRRVVRAPFLVRSDLVLEAVSRLRRTSGSAGLQQTLQALADTLDGVTALLGVEGTVVAGDPGAAPEDTRDLLGVPMARRSGADVLLTHPISLAPRERPTFWLVCRLHEPTAAWQAVATDILELASWSVAVRMVADRLQRERDARFRLGVLNAVVAAQERPEPVLLEQLGVLGWQVDGWCTGISLQASGDVDPLRVLTLTEDLQRQLAAAGLRGPLVERPDGWTMWIVDRKEPPPASYRQVVNALHRAAEAFVGSVSRVRLHAGVGRPYEGLGGLRSSLAEAKEAATIAQATGDELAVQHIDDMGIRRILLGWYASDTFAEFAHTLLAPLLQADHDGELTQTLESYLDHESSATLAATALGVHRNTVLNRLERLRSLLTVDLDDPNERLAVQLACRVIKLKTR
jgi:purine catabolism regulator